MSIYKVLPKTQSHRDDQAELKKIKDANERRNTYARLRGFMLGVRIFLYILILWSILTESGYLAPQLIYFTGSKILAIGMLVIIICLIEGIKYAGGTLLVRMFTQNWFKDGYHYWGIGFLLLLLVGTAFGGSAYFSIFGAPEIPAAFDRVSTNVELIDLDAIHSQYDQRIALEEDAISTASSMTWRGAIVSDGREIIQSAQDNKEEIEQQRQLEISAAITENQRRQNGHDTGLRDIGATLGAFGGIGEALTLLCLILTGVFERNVYNELPEAPEVEAQKRALPTSQKQSSGGDGGIGVPPGVTYDPVTPPIQTVPPVPNGAVPQSVPPVPNGKKVLSEQGDTPFTSSNGEQQRNGVETVFLEDSHTIEHVTANGEIKRMRRVDVSRRIRLYTKRIKEYSERIAAGEGNKKTQEALENSQEWLVYWESRLKEFQVPA